MGKSGGRSAPKSYSNPSKMASAGMSNHNAGGGRGSEGGGGTGAPKAGRGHKQKGSGNVIVGKAPVVTADGIVLRAHERLPTQLLQEYCQKEKRPAPRYVPKPPGHRVMVWCNDAKNAKDDLCFCPNQTEFESGGVARNFAALLALFKFQQNMPLQNKLPEPYNVTWKAMVVAEAEKPKDKAGSFGKGGAKVGGAGGGRAKGTTGDTGDMCRPAPLPLPIRADEDILAAREPTAYHSTQTHSSAVRVEVPELNAAIADWLCISCSTQNFAKLQVGNPKLNFRRPLLHTMTMIQNNHTHIYHDFQCTAERSHAHQVLQVRPRQVRGMRVGGIDQGRKGGTGE